ncbi:DUF5361 domain-containing protein [Schaalia odontolytica]|jgi:hypothetical protein|uniref:DUF5361 domain-containing protein n=1 Tax=Schaalia odontolytica TaxID=1660 RepID=UPI001D093ADB|nr:DUF5361 domain-containing protein [Schaalia odontolytica]MCB6401518.1 DUF5361 domain-containing protein [Schaalia odontolytica]
MPGRQAARLASVIIKQTESWTLRAIDQEWQWRSIDTHLAAIQADSLRWLQWAKTEAAQKGRGAPPPIPRPGTRVEIDHMPDTDWIDKQLSAARAPVEN